MGKRVGGLPHFTMRLSRVELAEWKAVARKEQRSVSAMIKSVVNGYVRRRNHQTAKGAEG